MFFAKKFSEGNCKTKVRICRPLAGETGWGLPGHRPEDTRVPQEVCTNDDLFHRLETVHFFRLFTGEGDMENMGRGSTEPRGLKARVLP